MREPEIVHIKSHLVDKDTKEFPIQVRGIVHIISDLEGMGYVAPDSFSETLNGWQMDFWHEMRMVEDRPNYPKNICFEGSLYYGDYKIVKR